MPITEHSASCFRPTLISSLRISISRSRSSKRLRFRKRAGLILIVHSKGSVFNLEQPIVKPLLWIDNVHLFGVDMFVLSRAPNELYLLNCFAAAAASFASFALSSSRAGAFTVETCTY